MDDDDGQKPRASQLIRLYAGWSGATDRWDLTEPCVGEQTCPCDRTVAHSAGRGNLSGSLLLLHQHSSSKECPREYLLSLPPPSFHPFCSSRIPSFSAGSHQRACAIIFCFFLRIVPAAT